LELVAYVGSAEAVRGAVVNGADAVRLGIRGFSPFASSFAADGDDVAAAAEYCRIRGVKVYLSVSLPPGDGGFNEALGLVLQACRRGADAVCSGDLGLLRALRQLLPETPLHADVSLGIHDSSGASFLASMGVSRLLLPHQLSKGLLERLSQRGPENAVELETACCGPQCAAYKSSCRMGAFSAKPGADGLCPGPCREGFGLSGASKTDADCLSLKDLSLSRHVPELAGLGLAALSVTGAERRPEYTAMAVGIFRRAIDGNRPASERDLELLGGAFFPSGASDAFYEERPDENLLEDKKRLRRKNKTVLASVRADYMGSDAQRVPVRMRAELRRGSNLRITAADDRGNAASASGPPPEAAGPGRRELTPAILKTQLYNTMGTPYRCEEARAEVDGGLYLPSADVSRARREALSRLSEMRRSFAEKAVGRLPEIIKYEGNKERPDLTFSVLKASQLSPQLAGTKPRVLYMPLSELRASPSSITPFWENGVTTVCAVLPPIVSDANAIDIYRELYALKELHIEEVMINSLSQLAPARVLGFRIRGGLNLNVANSHALKVLKEQGLVSAMLSPELRLRQIGEISKCIDTELPAYGRLPLMVTEHCVMKRASGVCSCEGAQYLCDRRGKQYPLFRAEGCRNVIYSPDKLFLAGRLRDFEALGLWCLNLAFTTENARECASIAGRYLQLNKFEPNAGTKGLYYA